jgi:hypothetical protein
MSNLIVETKTYNLSTRGSAGKILNTDPNYKSLIEYVVPDMITRDESIEYIYFSIPYAVIPISFYQINENNNTLDVLENGINSSYSFPQGNYSANTFITEFRNLLGSQWSISLNSFNSIFTVTNSLHNFTFYKSSTITSVMGFSTDLSSTVVSNLNTLVMTRVCNFFPLPRICIRCSQLLTNNFMVSNTTGSSDIIVSIPNNSKLNGQLYYQNQNNEKILYLGQDITKLTIKISDDDNNEINFNGISSFFTIQFDIFRKYIPKPDTFQNILNFVNSKNYKLPDDEILES